MYVVETRPDRPYSKSPSTDQQLLTAVLVGDKTAWAEFQCRFEPLLRMCVRRVLRRYTVKSSRDDIEDLVHESWVQLLADDYRRLRRFDSSRGVRLSSWLGLVATNTTIDRLRRRRDEAYLEDMASPENLVINHSSPHTLLERRQQRMMAQRALDQLQETDRVFLMACYDEERPPAQLAEEMGVSVNTIYTRRFRIRAKLVKALASVMAPGTELAVA